MTSRTSRSPGRVPRRSRRPPVVRRRQRGIALTYGVTLVELGFETLYPLATGIAVDGLLDGRPPAVLLLVGVWLAHTVVGVVRQRHDTRLFTRLYAEAVTEFVAAQGGRGVPTATLAGRAALARELVDFLEFDVPGLLTTVVGALASLALLSVYEARAAGLAVLLLAVAGVLNWRYARSAGRIDAELNDAAENEVDVIAGRRPRALGAHLTRVADLRVRLSDAEARTWGSTELVAVAVTVAVLVLLTRDGSPSPGDVFAALAYLWALLAAVDTLPSTVERTVQARDVLRRLDLAGVDGPDPPADPAP
ncbi:hypothetical protein DQ238_02855 [Geodermatophilus sp. TF02-6]|uniref:ABC transporter six-transmembrane domain-containing protein n=1 Tax=Geodermatophilus sp. TF02-6 TaxID=2250575 RepID=UPI000DEBC92C|nr:ABC transporter six-transmembrane domain-containing protein [Geodermatophilus sp. TF02-6]RBY82952.1 hypothetical protein DQ238_02855 [Geodermatophilus sp. TF02-6]